MEFLVLWGLHCWVRRPFGLLGERRWAPEVNVGFSLVTFLAACALTSRS